METNGHTSVKFPAWFIQAILYALVTLLSAIVTYTRVEFNDLKTAFQDYKDAIAEVHSDFKSRQLLLEYRQNDTRKVLDDYMARMMEYDRDQRGYYAPSKRKVERPNRQSE